MSDVTMMSTSARATGVPGANRGPATRAEAGIRPVGPAGPAGRRPGGGGATPRQLGHAQRGLEQAARGFAMLWLEVERGRRPLRQLRPLVGAELLDRLEQVPRRGGPPARVLRCTGMRAGEDVYEAVVVLQAADRVSALCLTLRRRTRCAPWRVTDLGRPEAQALPPARCSDPDDEDGDGGCPQVCRPPAGPGPAAEAHARGCDGAEVPRTPLARTPLARTSLARTSLARTSLDWCPPSLRR